MVLTRPSPVSPTQAFYPRAQPSPSSPSTLKEEELGACGGINLPLLEEEGSISLDPPSAATLTPPDSKAGSGRGLREQGDVLRALNDVKRPGRYLINGTECKKIKKNCEKKLFDSKKD